MISVELEKLKGKNLEVKVLRLNLTLIEGGFKLDRIFYGAQLKPLSFPHGWSQVRKLKEDLGMFSTKNVKIEFFEFK